MLIILYYVVVTKFLPRFVVLFNELTVSFLMIVISLAGLVMLLGACGMRISENLGSTIVNNVFRIIRAIFRGIFRTISRIARYVRRALVRVFRSTRTRLQASGVNAFNSNMIAFLLTTLLLVIII